MPLILSGAFSTAAPFVPQDFGGTFLYEFFDHIWLQAGVDDPFNADLAQWFLGGALRFTDEDLKTLMTVAPSP